MSFITGANVTVMVADLDKAIGFYTDILGFTLRKRYGDHWADIEGPGIAIGLHPTDKRNGVGDNLQIGLRVNNLEEAITELSQNGIQFQPSNDDNVRIAFFNDPDGNTLYLVQP